MENRRASTSVGATEKEREKESERESARLERLRREVQQRSIFDLLASSVIQGQLNAEEAIQRAFDFGREHGERLRALREREADKRKRAQPPAHRDSDNDSDGDSYADKNDERRRAHEPTKKKRRKRNKKEDSQVDVDIPIHFDGVAPSLPLSSPPRYEAFLSLLGQRIPLGVFDSEEEAARARDRALLRAVGPQTLTQSSSSSHSPSYSLNFPIYSYARDSLEAFTLHDKAVKRAMFGNAQWTGFHDVDFSFLIANNPLALKDSLTDSLKPGNSRTWAGPSAHNDSHIGTEFSAPNKTPSSRDTQANSRTAFPTYEDNQTAQAVAHVLAPNDSCAVTEFESPAKRKKSKRKKDAMCETDNKDGNSFDFNGRNERLKECSSKSDNEMEVGAVEEQRKEDLRASTAEVEGNSADVSPFVQSADALSEDHSSLKHAVSDLHSRTHLNTIEGDNTMDSNGECEWEGGNEMDLDIFDESENEIDTETKERIEVKKDEKFEEKRRRQKASNYFSQSFPFSSPADTATNLRLLHRYFSSKETKYCTSSGPSSSSSSSTIAEHRGKLAKVCLKPSGEGSNKSHHRSGSYNMNGVVVYLVFCSKRMHLCLFPPERKSKWAAPRPGPLCLPLINSDTPRRDLEDYLCLLKESDITQEDREFQALCESFVHDALRHTDEFELNQKYSKLEAPNVEQFSNMDICIHEEESSDEENDCVAGNKKHGGTTAHKDGDGMQNRSAVNDERKLDEKSRSPPSFSKEPKRDDTTGADHSSLITEQPLENRSSSSSNVVTEKPDSQTHEHVQAQASAVVTLPSNVIEKDLKASSSVKVSDQEAKSSKIEKDSDDDCDIICESDQESLSSTGKETDSEIEWRLKKRTQLDEMHQLFYTRFPFSSPGGAAIHLRLLLRYHTLANIKRPLISGSSSSSGCPSVDPYKGRLAIVRARAPLPPGTYRNTYHSICPDEMNGVIVYLVQCSKGYKICLFPAECDSKWRSPRPGQMSLPLIHSDTPRKSHKDYLCLLKECEISQEDRVFHALCEEFVRDSSSEMDEQALNEKYSKNQSSIEPQKETPMVTETSFPNTHQTSVSCGADANEEMNEQTNSDEVFTKAKAEMGAGVGEEVAKEIEKDANRKGTKKEEVNTDSGAGANKNVQKVIDRGGGTKSGGTKERKVEATSAPVSRENSLSHSANKTPKVVAQAILQRVLEGTFSPQSALALRDDQLHALVLCIFENTSLDARSVLLIEMITDLIREDGAIVSDPLDPRRIYIRDYQSLRECLMGYLAEISF